MKMMKTYGAVANYAYGDENFMDAMQKFIEIAKSSTGFIGITMTGEQATHVALFRTRKNRDDFLVRTIREFDDEIICMKYPGEGAAPDIDDEETRKYVEEFRNEFTKELMDELPELMKKMN